MRLGKFLLRVLFLMVLPLPVAAQPLIVDDDGQGTSFSCDVSTPTYATIGAAVAAAGSNTTILVCPGTYVENVDFQGKAITVRSTDGPTLTTIDGNALDSVVTFDSAETLSSVLEGFTIRNGRPTTGGGGGIRIANASPTIRGNIITGNRACSGIGISVSVGSPLIEANWILDNEQAGCSGGTGGGGIGFVGASQARVLRNTILRNVLTSASGGGISLFASGAVRIERNVIAFNRVSGLSPCASGGGIAIANDSPAVIATNVIASNQAGCGGGVSWIVPSGSSGLALVNNTVVDNEAAQGSGVFADAFDASVRLVNNIVRAALGQTAIFCGNFNDTNPPIIRYNNVFSATGPEYGGVCADVTGTNGNISADPLFVAAGRGDYRLVPASPGLDAGDNLVPELPALDLDGDVRLSDADGTGGAVVDLGADELVTRDVAVDFGPPYGIWAINAQGGWRAVLCCARTAGMVTGDLDGNGRDDLIVDFFDFGAVSVWAWMNQETWVHLEAAGNPMKMAIADLDNDGRDDLLLTYEFSLGVYRLGRPTLDHYAISPTQIATGRFDGFGGADVVINNTYSSPGVFVFRNNRTWTQIHDTQVQRIAVADLDGNGQDDIVLDFPVYGLWVYANNGIWTPLHGFNSTLLATGDLNGDGQVEVIVDFGPPYGLWIAFNNTGWAPLHGRSAEQLLVADLDANGRADVIVDFGDLGLWVFKNNSVWQQLHNRDPGPITVGRLH